MPTTRSRMPAERLLTVEEAAEQINMARRSVYNRINAGEIAVINVGSKLRPRLRIHPMELDRFLASRMETRPGARTAS